MDSKLRFYSKCQSRSKAIGLDVLREESQIIVIASFGDIRSLMEGGYHVFGKKELEPVNRFALITSFAFLLFATLPLMNHLGHPERAFNIFFTPNFSSAIAGFGVLYNTYFAILLLEIWFVWRKDIILIARRSRGLKRFIYALLALGTYDISEEALNKDKNVIRVLAAIGIPNYYAWAYYALFQAATLAGDEDEAARNRERGDLWGILGQN